MSKFSNDKGYAAFRTLQVAFVVAPIVAGFDKFFNVLTTWSQYLSPFVINLVGGHSEGFMMFAGIVEIIAGIGVLLKPRIFAFIVSIWLIGVIINLLMTGMYFDIALRDVGLLLGSFALGLLSQKYAK